MVENKSHLIDEKELASLEEISFEELERGVFCPGRLYWIKRNGRPLKLLEVGEVLDHEYIAKFKRQDALLKIYRISNLGVVTEGKMLLQAFKNAESEMKRVELREELLKWFKSIYWDGSRSGSLLDLVRVTVERFYNFDEKTSNHLREASILLYKRSALVGAFGVMTALALGYLDYKLLSDIYHLCFLFDYSLDHNSLSFNLLNAIELERQRSGKGVACLFLGENPGPELEIFQSHPMKSFEITMKECQAIFHDPHLLRLILRHHEKINGKGFPLGLNEHEMSDLELMIILINHIVTYENLDYQLNDGKGFYRHLIMFYEHKGIDEFFSLRLKHLISEIFERIKTVTEDVAVNG